MQQKEAVEKSTTNPNASCDSDVCQIDSMPRGTRNRWVQCEDCDKWFHDYCVDLADESDEYMNQLEFTCDDCDI